MAKDVHDDSRRNALHQQQSRARVSKVVEASLRQPSFGQLAMKIMADDRSVKRSAAIRREYKI
jgi:hypothetical protein